MKKRTDFYGGMQYMNRKQKIKATRERNAEKAKTDAMFKFLKGLGAELEDALCSLDKKEG